MNVPAEDIGTVRRRRVIFVPGYDPFPPRRYREMYRSEGAKQAEISGYEIAVEGDPKQGGTRWTVRAVIEGAQVDTQVQVLLWSDIVQASMDRGVAATYWLMLRTAWIYLQSGALRRLMRLRAGPIIAALYPAVMLILQLVVAVALGAGFGVLIAGLIWPLLFWPVLLITTLVILRAFKRVDGRIYAYYLMHDYAFSASQWGAPAPDLIHRMATFTDQIAEALSEDVDEVLVVGHSSGAEVAVMVLADFLRRGDLPTGSPALSLLTLGQVIPMTAFLPGASGLRRDLYQMAGQGQITWVDISAPGDGASFALCDPVAVSGVAPPDKRWPLVLSAAFSQTLKPATLAAIKRRFFRMHVQYLCAFDNPGEYDYFRVTAGPKTLAARFGHRAPSASRIEVPTSPHTTMAP
ncbi:MAG: hypothetical protein GKR99_07550 [Rhodobacteraceae bacterium]|nr:hypothetical protein [Paracoccaceae bacterium]